MQGDFSVLYFDPYQHKRGVQPQRNGVLRNVNGVLHQQGRVTLDADLTEGELLDLGWQEQAGRDIIGAGVAAVPAAEPDGFQVDAAIVNGSDVLLRVRPGRVWADGILTRLAGDAGNAAAAVERLATYFGPPLSTPMPTPDSIGDGVRDAVILEVSEESLHGFQYPERLIEAALGGPDTAERGYVNYRFRLLRLERDEDCTTILGKLADDPASKGKLSVSLAPATTTNGDCPVVGGGGYTGFEHFLYRIEIAETNGPARFKWSQWNGGLAGRGRFDATLTPARVVIDAGRAAIVSSGLAEFYLEALQYDDLLGAWRVVYGTTATLNTDHDLELTAPPAFGALPSTADPVFFRLWNGLEEITDFTNAVTPVELRDGIRLVFDAPAAGNYRPGDYWTFPVRAGEIPNPPVLLDHAPPAGVAYHRVPLAEINWTGRKNTTIDGSIEDCRKRFRPLTNQKICCTFLIGDGVSSFGDFNSLEEAAAHLPAAGGELCLLPGLHRANLTLTGRRNVTIHGCDRRSVVIPRANTQGVPIIKLVDCSGVHISQLDLLSFDATPIVMEGQKEGSCRDIRIERTRMIGRVNAIRATSTAELVIAHNRLHLLDTIEGFATISIASDDTLIERNTLVMLPFVERPPDPNGGTDDPDGGSDPADPCTPPVILYAQPVRTLAYATKSFTLGLAALAVAQPFRGLGGIHVRAGSERVRILENTIVGGAGNGVTLGGDIDPPPPPIILTAPPPRIVATTAATAVLGATARAAVASNAAGAASDRAALQAVSVNVTAKGQFLALIVDVTGKPVADVDLYLEGPMTASDRSDDQGMVSIKTKPGAYTMDVSPDFEILNVKETRDEGVLLNVVTVGRAVVAPPAGTAFLHEITIQENDISLMGLSGIGFALLAGAALRAAPVLTATGAKATLVAEANRLAVSIGLAPLVRAATPVRDLVIVANRLHRNLQTPFTDQMRAEAMQFGRGGISLAIVDTAAIADNQVHDNGGSAIDPICGVFVGYANNLDVIGNRVSGNGLVTADYEQNVRAGLRGGVFVQFAGALTSESSASVARVPAVRIHDNRVDQPAGRALTITAFGPVSCVHNHLNSERAGTAPIVDLLVGCVLINNVGGVQQMIARDAGSFVGSSTAFAAAAAPLLPGGETLMDGNNTRLGNLHRSMSSVLVSGQDIGYSSNQSTVLRPGAFLVNAFVFGDSVRATSGRFSEESRETISLYSQAQRINMTALNQADHCIVTLPPVVAGNVLPTVAAPNQVIDGANCASRFANASAVGRFATEVLSTYANELGGTLPADAFTAAELQSLSRQLLSRALAGVSETQIATTRAYQLETARLSAKLGDDHPRVAALKAQADAGVQISRLVAISSETVAIQPPSGNEKTATISGRLINAKGQGQGGLVVELAQTDGTRVALVGRTDESGFYAQSFDERTTAALAKQGTAHLRFLDVSGRELYFAKEAITIRPGADIRTTTTIPVRVVPQSVASGGKVIFTKPESRPAEPREPDAPAPKAKRPAAPRRRPRTGKKKKG